jgi:hypothetical protein
MNHDSQCGEASRLCIERAEIETTMFQLGTGIVILGVSARVLGSVSYLTVAS